MGGAKLIKSLLAGRPLIRQWACDCDRLPPAPPSSLLFSFSGCCCCCYPCLPLSPSIAAAVHQIPRPLLPQLSFPSFLPPPLPSFPCFLYTAPLSQVRPNPCRVNTAYRPRRGCHTRDVTLSITTSQCT